MMEPWYILIVKNNNVEAVQEIDSPGFENRNEECSKFIDAYTQANFYEDGINEAHCSINYTTEHEIVNYHTDKKSDASTQANLDEEDENIADNPEIYPMDLEITNTNILRSADASTQVNLDEYDLNVDRPEFFSTVLEKCLEITDATTNASLNKCENNVTEQTRTYLKESEIRDKEKMEVSKDSNEKNLVEINVGKLQYDFLMKHLTENIEGIPIIKNLTDIEVHILKSIHGGCQITIQNYSEANTDYAEQFILTGDNYFKCSLCSEIYPHKYTLRQHLLVVHNKGFVCGICNKVFYTITHFGEHRRQMEIEIQRIYCSAKHDMLHDSCNQFGYVVFKTSKKCGHFRVYHKE